ncbi:MAG: NUDIX hydrolase [Oscillospiraceae bacterium]|nr:NUDIX hydrolase [Oscillospiraceae bacterium]
MVVPEKKIDSELIYDGCILKVEKDSVMLEGVGKSVREVVRHKGAAAILAVDEEGFAYFVEQFRYPVNRPVFEVPAGKIDEGETPFECAKRELFEECGLSAEKWTELGPMLSSPGFCDEVIHLFLAEKLSNDSPNPDEDEFLDIIKLPLCEVLSRIRKNLVPDAKTQVLVLRGCDILGIR